MVNPRIDVTRDVDGEPVVLALVDIGEEELKASSQAVRAVSADRYRTASLSTDDVLELRELTALADQLADAALVEGMRTLVLRPARLSAYRNALEAFVADRDEAEWLRSDDREALPLVTALLWPLEDLCAEAMRAALSPEARREA